MALQSHVHSTGYAAAISKLHVIDVETGRTQDGRQQGQTAKPNFHVPGLCPYPAGMICKVYRSGGEHVTCKCKGGRVPQLTTRAMCSNAQGGCMCEHVLPCSAELCA
eukprot:1157324-Pelagomonas_calceolata.AAC.4